MRGDYNKNMKNLEAQLSMPFPQHWTVQEAVDAYLAENGFPIEDYDKSVVDVTFWAITVPFPNPPSRQLAVRFHDLHHVVTGYGTDPTGEAEVSAWEARRGVGVFAWFVRSIVWSGLLFGMLHSPRRTLAAWRAAYSPASVGLQPATMQGYAKLLEMDVGALRRLYGVPPDGISCARSLHHGAPSRVGEPVV